MAVVQSPIFHILEIGLLGCVVFHGLNGIRVILLDYAGAADKGPHKTWVWATLAVSAAITVIGGIPMLQMAFH
jgi:succinate dehydrogenase / fumarate reductase cytochrome b subunit